MAIIDENGGMGTTMLVQPTGMTGNGGYSRTGDTREQLRQMMEEAPDEQTRMEIRNLMERMG